MDALLSEFQDVFGPDGDSVGAGEHPALSAWVIVSHWEDMSEPQGWTVGTHSGCTYPMRLGLLAEGTHNEMDR